MKKIQTLIAATLAATALNVHAADTPEIDSIKEVAYTCKIAIAGKQDTMPITAMYGIKDNKIVVAQLKLNNSEITPGMWRDDFVIMNRFISNDPEKPTTVWTAFPADANTVATVDGGKLSVAKVAGAQQEIIAEGCKLDKAATAKLTR
ncbi:hypothetical protein QDY71_02695 [Kingella negevensis]|uniref:Uncharacterized protein n=1 Tax=Kingella negevensis TaxID=1522312 RepID=A0A238HFM8_9NEIS|nr:hypothetical protein [Kingella negevensis]MDK4679530.1 hypothetical protein [Kingella negevensis]MDK4682752.1 hypothetical protein [Kingella negevensis]MDK4685096.1 hypothetical protein [Kingella negevensis]MDK4690949.1 hypothetical protein [Kingella negevensis]MDK4693904.1 hypothetical protein [Kingella negevensis]